MTWRGTSPNRTRGRKWMAIRERIIARDGGICAECRHKGTVTKDSMVYQVGHIIALMDGGTDDDVNLECECREHATAKTAAESARAGASNYPEWLEQSAIPLKIVCGPPASGKTTYIEQHAHPNDIIIDLDGIMRRLRPSYIHWTGSLDRTLFNAAIRERNRMLGSLKRESDKRAWFIVSAPSPHERTWWQRKLGGEIVLLHPGVDECKRRAVDRGTPKAVKGIDAWERSSRSPWVEPEVKRQKQAIGSDGWPA